LAIGSIGDHEIKQAVVSSGRLQAWRPQPFAHVGTGIRLSCSTDQVIARSARWKRLGLMTQALCLFGKTLLEKVGLLETAALLHGLLSMTCTKLETPQMGEVFRRAIHPSPFVPPNFGG
jgi:hypothetical protein